VREQYRFSSSDFRFRAGCFPECVGVDAGTMPDRSEFTTNLPSRASETAPDGSIVRPHLGLAGGTMAHFEIVAVTIPRWPGNEEAEFVAGPWRSSTDR
jgi:hypothetical protein